MRQRNNISKRAINEKYKMSYFIYMDTSERYDLDDNGKIKKKSQSLTIPNLDRTSPSSPDSDDLSLPSVSPNLTISAQPFAPNHLTTQPPPQKLNKPAKTPNSNDDLTQIEDDLSFSFSLSDDDDDNDNILGQYIGIDDNFLF